MLKLNPVRPDSLPERFYLLVASRAPHKNIPRVVKAHGLALRSAGDIPSLVVVGGAGRAFASGDSGDIHTSDPGVVYLGRVPDEQLVWLYRNCVAFIFPSLYEGFGIPAIEAQAFGAPVLASDISVMHEILGDSALYFDPHDVESIANALTTQLHARSRCGTDEVLGDPSSRYSWMSTAELIIDGLRER